jgi:YVTN family beta-propeller protein
VEPIVVRSVPLTFALFTTLCIVSSTQLVFAQAGCASRSSDQSIPRQAQLSSPQQGANGTTPHVGSSPQGAPSAQLAPIQSNAAQATRFPGDKTSSVVVDTVAGMPQVVDPSNLYSEAGPNCFAAFVTTAIERVYVPHVGSRDIYVIDPKTLTVVDRFSGGHDPQHVVPSFDLQTLWVTGSARGRRHHGSLMPINPATGKPGALIPVIDAYNMYFTPDGASAIVVAEAERRLDFRDPKTMALQRFLPMPECLGVNHADFAIDGRYAIFTCEFNGSLAKVDVINGKVLGYLKLAAGGMPQDIRISSDGKIFYVANMMRDGVTLIDGDKFTEIGYIPTGIGAHGLYPSRDGTKLYVSNRGSHSTSGGPRGPGSISVVDFATRRVEANWPIPGGGSPDMGNVSADGTRLWVSGRFDDVVYVIDTRSGHVDKIPVGRTPHGLTVWPQPGRYSLGHTGNMR